MRRTLLSVLSAVVLAAFATGSPAADEGVMAVINRAIKAEGGEEVLTKYKASRSKSKGKMTVPNVGETDFTQESATMLPGKLKETLQLDLAGQKIEVLTVANGDNVSITAAGNEVPVTDDIKNALKASRYLMKIVRLVPLTKDKNFELSSLGEVKVNDKPAVGVLVKSKGQKDVSLFFDKDTGLLSKVEHRTVQPGGKEITEERIILKYFDKNKQGIVLPKEILVKHDGETFMKAEVLEATVLESIDDNEFKK
jgi:hypothetical protein